jgi:hypothetical protein
MVMSYDCHSPGGLARFGGGTALVEGAAVVEGGLGYAEAVEDLDLEEAPVIDARVAPLRDGELEVQPIVAERLGGHEIGAAVVPAAEQHRTGPTSRADPQEPGRVGRVESHVVADDPDLLRSRVAGHPASEVLAVEQGRPPVVGPGHRSCRGRQQRDEQEPGV